MTIAPTISLQGAAEMTWDALVVGAGPAGSLAASCLARRGVTTLLVDRAAFPRWKVCGCCIGIPAQRTLAEAGLPLILDDLDARSIDRVDIHCAGRSITAPLAPTRILSRESLDAALIDDAITAGAEFVAETRARLHPSGRLTLTRSREVIDVRAHAVVIASGLHDAAPQLATTPRYLLARASHIGLGATGDPGSAPNLSHHLTMVVGRGAYVGFVHLQDGRLNAAAAVAPSLLRKHPSPAHAIERLLAQAGVEGVDPHRLRWRGTPPLTRARPGVQHGSAFLVGDAARFVEPVTGEGMSWALATGVAVVPHVLERLGDENAAQTWPRAHARLLRARHLRCSIVSRAMRSPALMSVFMTAMRVAPAARESMIRALIGTPSVEAEHIR